MVFDKSSHDSQVFIDPSNLQIRRVQDADRALLESRYGEMGPAQVGSNEGSI